jgi:PIN domain nuclease of toxin-antitoxin system
MIFFRRELSGMLNLDTHVLIFALADQLETRERTLLSKNLWSISAVVLWELEKLFQLGRVNLDIHDSEVSRVINKLHIWPIDLQVCKALRSLDFKSDPADELIAATSLVHEIPLLTRDRKIRKTKIVPLA